MLATGGAAMARGGPGASTGAGGEKSGAGGWTAFTDGVLGVRTLGTSALGVALLITLEKEEVTGYPSTFNTIQDHIQYSTMLCEKL